MMAVKWLPHDTLAHEYVAEIDTSFAKYRLIVRRVGDLWVNNLMEHRSFWSRDEAQNAAVASLRKEMRRVISVLGNDRCCSLVKLPQDAVPRQCKQMATTTGLNGRRYCWTHNPENAERLVQCNHRGRTSRVLREIGDG